VARVRFSTLVSRLWSLGVGAAALTIAILSVPSGTRAAGPEEDLPDGEGKKILLASCTSCHELSEVTKFRGYYDRTQWRDIVVTMMEYGAPVDEKQVDILADYLAKHLGKQ
jgi:mono/diheme cytochrome c family protein